MSTAVILLIIGIIVMIIFLSRGSSDREEAREKFLRDLTKFFNGIRNPLDDLEDSYRISFRYGGFQWLYEDVKEEGIGERTFSRGYLKVATPSSLSLTFMERGKPGILLQKSQGVIKVPQQLKEFAVTASNADVLNKLFDFTDAVKVFEKFKNIDSRGHPMMSLGLKEGTLILKFHSPDDGLSPSILDLQYEVPSLEDYMNKMLVVVKRLEEIEAPED